MAMRGRCMICFPPRRREVYHLQRELLRERTRCKALEEELENPMNIHRWRKLEGSDPSTYEMIQKIQTLQVLRGCKLLEKTSMSVFYSRIFTVFLFLETSHLQNRGGRRKGVTDSRKGEVVCRTQTHSRSPTRTGSG